MVVGSPLSLSSPNVSSSQIGELHQNHKEKSIFTIYKEIKHRNEALKASTYTWFWKKTSSTQHRKLSSFDTEKGNMQIAFLEPKVTHPRSANDYTKSIFTFDTNLIHPIDQIGLHEKYGKMIYSSHTSSSMVASKLQKSLDNV